jgi:hypothetical protein
MFSGVGSIVAGHADDLAGGDGRKQLDFIQRIAGFASLVGAEEIAFDRANFVLQEPAVARFASGCGVADDFHSS